MKKLLLLFLLSCGDNIKPSDGKVEPTYDDTWPDLADPQRPFDAPAPPMGDAEAAIDAAAMDAMIDAPKPAATPPKCCVGALNGDVPIECGPPNGKCTRFACDGVELLVCRRAE